MKTTSINFFRNFTKILKGSFKEKGLLERIKKKIFFQIE